MIKLMSVFLFLAFLTQFSRVEAQIAPRNLDGANLIVARLDLDVNGPFYGKCLSEIYRSYMNGYLANGARCLRLQLFSWDFLGAVIYNDPSRNPNNYLDASSEQLWQKYFDDNDGVWVGLKQQIEIIRTTICPIIKSSRYKGVKFIIDLHTPLGLYSISTAKNEYRNNDRLLDDNKYYENYFIRSWEYIAKESKDLPECIGYDLQNEPSHVDDRYQNRIQKTIDIIRNNGAKSQWIFVETNTDPRSIMQLTNFNDVSNRVAYSIHWYVPINFNSDKKEFSRTKKRIDTIAKEIKEWQISRGNPVIWIGEYSAPFEIGNHLLDYVDYSHKKFLEYGWGANIYIDNPSIQLLTHLHNFWSKRK